MPAEQRLRSSSFAPDELLFRCLMLGTRLIDGEGCSCIYVSITQDVKVVDSQGYMLDLEDE
jgi:hypothetical protein